MNSYLLIIIIGAFIGTSSALFGVGGALIATPMLKLWLGLPAMLALATPLPAALPSALSGSVLYSRNGLIEYKLAARALCAALPANILGTWCTRYTGDSAIMLLTGIFMILVGITFIVRGWLLKEKAEELPRISWMPALLAGAGSGFLAGFLAIGGGIVLVPVFLKVNRLPMKKAIATSLFCVLILSLPGSIGHYFLGHIQVDIALLLMITVPVFSYAAARLVLKVRSRTLERAYGIFMICFAIYFLLNNA